MELLESSGVRPRQARYQAALRPDMKCLFIRNFPTLLQTDSSVSSPDCARTMHEWTIAAWLCTMPASPATAFRWPDGSFFLELHA
jgi:hypothetical protein